MDDEPLIKEIAAAAKGECPPLFGRMEFTVPGAPVSLQAKLANRQEYESRVRKAYAGNQFLLIGDIQIEFRWWISARSRYETDASADIDNALKPTIDALSGPNGLFVDDCQIRGLQVAWSHSDKEQEFIEVRLEFTPDEWYPSNDLVFLNLGNGLCIPSPKQLPTAGKQQWCEILNQRIGAKEELLSMGASYPWAASLLLAPRPFHRTRVNGFTVLTEEEYLNHEG